MAFQFGEWGDLAWQSILESDARLNFWTGAVRSGKTIASTVRWLEFVQTAPPGDLMMLGKTERTLSANILNTVEEMVGPSRWQYNRGMGEATLFGRRILIRGANDRNAEGKIRGATLAGAYGDEVVLWPIEVFKQLLARLSVKGAQFFGTTNPDSPFHWLMVDFLSRAGLDLKQWHFTLDDNPNLDPAYVANLKREYAGLWYKRFVDGLWVQAEGAIYDAFDPDKHVVKELPEGNPSSVVVSVDYGTSNPTVFLMFGKWGLRWYVMREYYHDGRATGRQKTDAEYSLDLRNFLVPYFPQSIEVDPSAASFIAQLRKDGVSGIRKADHAVLDGIRTVSRAMQTGTLVIHASCQRLIAEKSTYAWDSEAQKRGEDKPLKINDHACDAERYAAMRIFGKGRAA